MRLVTKEEIDKGIKEQNTCRKCRTHPLRRQKLSKYHPQWKEESKQLNFNKIKVEKVNCPKCGYEYFESCGEDNNLEQGLK